MSLTIIFTAYILLINAMIILGLIKQSNNSAICRVCKCI